MGITTFIFSRSKSSVFLRHGAFWLMWIVFYTSHLLYIRYYNGPELMSFQSRFLSSLSTVVLTTFVDMAYVYTIIYLLIPKYFFKGRFLFFMFAWLIITLFTAYLFRLQTVWMLVPLDVYFGYPKKILGPLPTALWSLSISIGFEGCMAAAIVLGKNWYKSNLHLLQVQQENQKINLSLSQSQKIMGSHFVVRDIFNDLSKEIDLMNCAGQQVNAVKSKSACIMEFLNAYFEFSGNGTVTLNQELEGLKKYISIKELDNYHFENEFSNNRPGNRIASHILLPLTALPYKNEAAINREKKISMNIHARGDAVEYTLSWHKKNIRDNLEKGQFEFLNAVKKYLEFNYPKSHKLSVSINDSIISVLLNIRLKENI